MGSTRRSYTPEYMAHSGAFVIDGGRPVAEVARNIGVHEMTLSTAPVLRVVTCG
jgi:transposase